MSSKSSFLTEVYKTYLSNSQKLREVGLGVRNYPKHL